MLLFICGLFSGFALGFMVCALWACRNTADFSHEKVIDLAVEKEKKIIKALNERGH